MVMASEDSSASRTPPKSVWKAYLYRLQQNAPSPIPVECYPSVSGKPSFYGSEFHGRIGREEARERLGNVEGAYLIRESPSAGGQYTLSMRCGTLRHFKLYWDGRHFVGDKFFEKLSDLVADGLIALYLEDQAGDYIRQMYQESEYAKSPYMTLNRFKRRVLRDSIRRRSAVMNGLSEKNGDGQVPPSSPPPPPEKLHNFNTHSFKGLNWCDLCGNFMWGIVAQGVKCDDCGFIAHHRCSERVPNDCCPDLKGMRGIFGLDLTTILKAYDASVPYVIEKCVTEIEKRGLNSEGVYRVSASADEVESLKLALDREGEHLNMSEYGVNVVAGVLKGFLRLLPIPLIVEEAQSQLLECIRQPNQKEQIRVCNEALRALPPAHYSTLQYLMQHLHTVSQSHTSNLMTVHNLSTVFCPTLMRSQDAAIIPLETAAIETMIKHHTAIFQ